MNDCNLFRCDWPAGRPEREGHGGQVFLVLQEVRTYIYPSISRPVCYPKNIVFIHKATIQCRSYKTGFVWHDLSVDDLLLLTQGTEYVLKGSELPFDQSEPLPMPGMNHEQL